MIPLRGNTRANGIQVNLYQNRSIDEPGYLIRVKIGSFDYGLVKHHNRELAYDAFEKMRDAPIDFERTIKGQIINLRIGQRFIANPNAR